MQAETSPAPQPTFRLAIYGFFIMFIGVNLYEAIATDLLTEGRGEKGFEFNYAVSSILDAIFRIAIAVVALCWSGNQICKSFEHLTWKLGFKLLFARFLIQAGEVLNTLGMAYLISSQAMVISQARIPLVGLLGYLILCKCLSRDQTIYAIAIIPLAAQFNLLEVENKESKNPLLGYFFCIAAVVFLSVSNVLVEKLLKKDFGNLKTWEQQFLFALADLPVMFAIYAILTWFEMHIVGIEERSWNPFNYYNMKNAHWIIAFGLNGAIWGFARLCILSYEGAMWLNLGMVLVMGLTWNAEILIAKVRHDENRFLLTKCLCLLSLSCILVGYELVSREKPQKSEETVEEPLI